VRIIEEIAGNQALEIRLAVSNAGFERVQRRFERQRRQRVTIVEPSFQRAQQRRDPTWEGAEIVLAQAKFDRVQGGVNCHPVDAFVGQRAERLEDECFDPIGSASSLLKNLARAKE
jgi:hypothetical protein